MTFLRWLRVQWDRALAVTMFTAGALALVIGWTGISDEVFAARQLPYLLSGGIGGLFLLGAGATLWLSADLRDEWHQLRRIEHRMAASAEAPADPETAASPVPPREARSANGGPAVPSGQLRP